MSNSSPRILRSGIIITSTSSNVLIESSSTQVIPSMENNNNSSDGQVQSGRNSPTNGTDLQQVNEEKFNHLQSEISFLKIMMEKLIAQNEERNRQLDASTATSSFAVRMSNTGYLGRILQKSGHLGRTFQRSGYLGRISP